MGSYRYEDRVAEWVGVPDHPAGDRGGGGVCLSDGLLPGAAVIGEGVACFASLEELLSLMLAVKPPTSEKKAGLGRSSNSYTCFHKENMVYSLLLNRSCKVQ